MLAWALYTEAWFAKAATMERESGSSEAGAADGRFAVDILGYPDSSYSPSSMSTTKES